MQTGREPHPGRADPVADPEPVEVEEPARERGARRMPLDRAARTRRSARRGAGRARVYSTGVRLDMTVLVRRNSAEGHRLHGGVSGRLSSDSTDRLLLGVEYADGRVATNVGAYLGRDLDEQLDESPSLSIGRSSGGRVVDATFFLSPVPPAGPVTVYCAWPGRDLAETRTVFDGIELAQALAPVQVLWALEPDPPHGPGPAVRPAVPEGGWFRRGAAGRPAALRLPRVD